ncbi:FAD/NAD(P)-binding protein [Nakamurella deserti]|uniref:FAD/NAD(P)-binding protein n=1 Tax=Nakamurella deserti TaxID=2164074 RepID=UPI000DBE6810|nr:FAD/NAD(P)-binding protein [Nakamurella deserti]
MTATLVFVGAGPRTTSLLERLAASSDELLGGRPVDIHVVDPYPPGGGRIWRRAQSPLLWMNSTAADVTMYPDASVQLAGPLVTGPSLAEWVGGPGAGILTAEGVDPSAIPRSPADFSSREVQSAYLSWVFDRAVAALPATVSVTTHRARVTAVDELSGDRQRVSLSDGLVIAADVVVQAQGYLDRTPTDEQADLQAAAASRGLRYVPPGYTADLDLDDVRPGEAVVVRGFGLAFVDLMVLLAEHRGGRFADGADGSLTYHPSGAEPVLYVGSRRGVPYHAKLGYVDLGAPPTPPRYLTPRAVEQIFAATGGLDYDRYLWPLLVRELHHAHYARLFRAHPDRVTGDWDACERLLAAADLGSAAYAAAIGALVPDPADRFDLHALDRPLAGETFDGAEALEQRLRRYIRADLDRRADPRHSADLAVFNALLSVYGVIGRAVAGGRIGAADRIRRIEGDLHGLFSFIASGPPPRRLAELLALNAAGLVRFLGPDLQVELLDDRFVAHSPAVPGVRVPARVFIEGRLPRPDVASATDPLIRSLLAAGQLAVEPVAATGAATPVAGGQLLADGLGRAKRADGTFHPRRFLLGPSVSGSLGSAGFSRPGYNSPFLRQNDAVARHLLALLRAAAGATAATPTAVAGGAPTDPPERAADIHPFRTRRPAAARPHAHDRIENRHAR